MSASEAVYAEPVSPTTVRSGRPSLSTPRSSVDESTVVVGKQGISRLNSRVADGASKLKTELVEGSLQLEDVL